MKVKTFVADRRLDGEFHRIEHDHSMDFADTADGVMEALAMIEDWVQNYAHLEDARFRREVDVDYVPRGFAFELLNRLAPPDDPVRGHSLVDGDTLTLTLVHESHPTNPGAVTIYKILIGDKETADRARGLREEARLDSIAQSERMDNAVMVLRQAATQNDHSIREGTLVSPAFMRALADLLDHAEGEGWDDALAVADALLGRREVD